MLRLIEMDGSVAFVEYPDGDDLPESILVKRPFHEILGTRYRLDSVPLRTYRYDRDEMLPARS